MINPVLLKEHQYQQYAILITNDVNRRLQRNFQEVNIEARYSDGVLSSELRVPFFVNYQQDGYVLSRILVAQLEVDNPKISGQKILRGDCYYQRALANDSRLYIIVFPFSILEPK